MLEIFVWFNRLYIIGFCLLFVSYCFPKSCLVFTEPKYIFNFFIWTLSHLFSDRLSSRVPTPSWSRRRRGRPRLPFRTSARASSSKFRRKFLHRRKSGWSCRSGRSGPHFGFVSQRSNETGKTKYFLKNSISLSFQFWFVLLRYLQMLYFSI